MGPAAWADILGPAPGFPVLETVTSADVVVIGAGFAGLAAARRLHQLDPDSRIAILDAGQVAEGAAGRNSGFMIDIPHELTSENYAGSDDRRIIGLNRQAQQFMADAVDEYDIPRAFFDRAGKVNGASSAAAIRHNDALGQHLDGLGEDYEYLDAQQMAEMTGSRHYQAGLYTPGTVMLQPAGIVRGLATGLANSGVRIFENSPVHAIARSGKNWLVRSESGSITSENVILCVNGHLESFGFHRRRLMHVFLFAAMTQNLPSEAISGQSRWGVTPADPMGTTVRRIDGPLGGNRIVTRATAVLRPGMQTKPLDIQRAKRTIQRKFDERFPQLAGAKMQHFWSGHLCLTQNGSGVVGRIDDGLYSACVQNGLGTTRGTLAGIAAADILHGVKSPAVEYFQDQPCPSKLPPQPFQQLGANAYLRFKEWQSRTE